MVITLLIDDVPTGASQVYQASDGFLFLSSSHASSSGAMLIVNGRHSDVGESVQADVLT